MASMSGQITYNLFSVISWTCEHVDMLRKKLLEVSKTQSVIPHTKDAVFKKGDFMYTGQWLLSFRTNATFSKNSILTDF